MFAFVLISYEHIYVIGWQWEAIDRPTFVEICVSLENMFDNKTVDEGRSFSLSYRKL